MVLARSAGTAVLFIQARNYSMSGRIVRPANNTTTSRKLKSGITSESGAHREYIGH
jgi:hypothetical protein